MNRFNKNEFVDSNLRAIQLFVSIFFLNIDHVRYIFVIVKVAARSTEASVVGTVAEALFSYLCASGWK